MIHLEGFIGLLSQAFKTAIYLVGYVLLNLQCRRRWFLSRSWVYRKTRRSLLCLDLQRDPVTFERTTGSSRSWVGCHSGWHCLPSFWHPTQRQRGSLSGAFILFMLDDFILDRYDAYFRSIIHIKVWAVGAGERAKRYSISWYIIAGTLVAREKVFIGMVSFFYWA